jgi:type IV secretory pathway VirB10-like protein
VNYGHGIGNWTERSSRSATSGRRRTAHTHSGYCRGRSNRSGTACCRHRAAFGFAGLQPATRNDDAAAVTSNEARAAVEELEAKARIPKPPEIKPVPLPPPPPTVVTQAPAAPLPARPPSRLAELQEEEYFKALSAPPMVEAFHHGGALEVPRLAGQTGPNGLNDFTSAQIAQSGSTSAITSVKPPESPYLITAGSVIPAVLISGINSELPGPILAQVRENVFDTATGRWVLIPQGSKLIGSYKTDAAYGQERVQIGWKRLIFPNASSMDIPQMPGADDAGYAGFSDEVNNHYLKIFGTAALLSVISAGQMVGPDGSVRRRNGLLRTLRIRLRDAEPDGSTQ